MEQLTQEQIDILARFDGWTYKKNEPPLISVWEKKVKGRRGMQQIPHWEMAYHLIFPDLLIKIRLKMVEAWTKLEFKKRTIIRDEFRSLDNLILTGQYTAAAIKEAEIIPKLQS